MDRLGQHVLDGMQLGLWLAAPALIASVLAGLVTGFTQAATQVQDTALSFVPRLLAVGLALAISAAWMTAKLVAFTTGLWQTLALVGS
jgi:flagellar biosynthetic protein FliQ